MLSLTHRIAGEVTFFTKAIGFAMGCLAAGSVIAQTVSPTLAPPMLAYESEMMIDDGMPNVVADSDSLLRTELNRMQRQIDELRGTTVIAPLPPASKEKVVFPTTRLTGFFQADAAWFGQDDANRLAVGDGDPLAGDVQDGVDFRRARLAAVGQAWDNVAYQLEMDFAFPGRPSFMDVWLDIENVIGNNHLRIGQFRQPVGMDALTSVRELTFLERALPFALLPFRQIGVMWYGNNDDEDMTWAFSAFRYPTDVFGGNIGDNGGYAMASRVTGLLIDRPNDDGLLHIGGGYSHLDPANDFVQYRNQPEIFVSETGGAALVPLGVPSNVPPFVDTGLIATDTVNLLNLELAGTYKSWHAQSEITYTQVDQAGGPSLGFPGAYAQVGYLLTGERRPYNGKAGVLGRIKPRCNVDKQGGIGAWEVAGRWSMLDLSDENIDGNRLNNLTGGVNWYLNPFTKFQFNYIHAMLDSAVYGDTDADIVAMRAQVDF